MDASVSSVPRFSTLTGKVQGRMSLDTLSLTRGVLDGRGQKVGGFFIDSSYSCSLERWKVVISYPESM